MVKKRTELHRIESIMRKKPKFSPISEASLNTQKEKNVLNDRILNLYKENVPTNDKSPLMQNEQELSQSNTVVLEPEKIKYAEEHKATDKTNRNLEDKKYSVFALKYSTLSFKDVGGLNNIYKELYELIMHLKNPRLAAKFGVRPVRGYLLHGPPGCGKTHLAQAIAGELRFPYIEVSATQLVGGISGESESKIQDMFDEAIKNAPCILVINEIDAFFPKRETTDRRMDIRMVTQLITCFDALNRKDRNDFSSHVLVIGATNRPNVIDPALRRGGRFEKELAIGIPDEDARLKILEILCKDSNLVPDFDMQWLAHHTPGYVGADLRYLVSSAGVKAMHRIHEKFLNSSYIKDQMGYPSDKKILPKFDFTSISPHDLVQTLSNSHIEVPEEECVNVYVEQQDFETALQDYVPSTKREGFASVPTVTWDDVGALEDIKKVLRKAILMPVKYKKFRMKKDILLYGPKGCGKTTLAKAIANECNINFLSVRGPELLSKYFGESERNVRECFQRASQCAPCVIFFDEFDAICPERTGSTGNEAAERVVTQLLAEMNGMEKRPQVFVIAATNRLEKIDSAMLRPGRLGKILFVDIPSPEGRIDILRSLTKNKADLKISDDVDLELIALDHRCDNFSGADLDNLVNEAYEEAMLECTDLDDCSSEECVEIKRSHIENVYSQVKPSITIRERKRHLKIYKSICGN